MCDETSLLVEVLLDVLVGWLVNFVTQDRIP